MDLELFTSALQLALTVSAPLLGAILVAGVVAGLLQTVTQISDESISLSMRILGICLAVFVLSNTALSQLQEFAVFAWGGHSAESTEQR